MKAKKKKKFSTSYVCNYKKYGSHIWAVSWDEAKQIAKQRNIGEKVYGEGGVVEDGYGRKKFEHELNPDFRKLNDYEFLGYISDVIHSACFMAMIAFNSGTMRFDELYSDEGVVHQLVHLMNKDNVTTRSIRRARGNFMNLQDKTIGMFP